MVLDLSRGKEEGKKIRTVKCENIFHVLFVPWKGMVEKYGKDYFVWSW